MAVTYKPSNAQSIEELKKYCEDMFREYADELNSIRINNLPTVASEPNPTQEGMLIINEEAGFDPTGEGKGVYTYINGAWKKLDT